MDVINQRCCGLDVHKKTVVACLRIMDPKGSVRSVVRTFGTITAEVLALCDWLSEAKVTHVAMESTGVFWKPIWNILEGSFQVLLVNARHLKQVPGRKTDVKDCEWIAQLLQHGLLRGSFVPPREIRDLRDLTRQRVQLVSEKTRSVNRIHKVLEDANIKLASVASDIMGVSGRDMLEALVDGQENPDQLAELARRRLRGKIPALKLALHGRFTQHHRFMLRMHLQHIKDLESLIGQLEQRVEELTRPLSPQLELLQTIPTIKPTSAAALLAEIGPDMEQFPTSGHLASWAAMCPGNSESAGKRKTGKTGKGNRWLRRALAEPAWAATRTKDTYCQAQYRRLAPRRGKKRALVAVGHTLLVAAYHILKNKVPYKDLGPEHFDRLQPDQLTRYHMKRLESLGHKVTLEPAEEAA